MPHHHIPVRKSRGRGTFFFILDYPTLCVLGLSTHTHTHTHTHTRARTHTRTHTQMCALPYRARARTHADTNTRRLVCHRVLPRIESTVFLE